MYTVKTQFFTRAGEPTLAIVSFELAYPDWLKLKKSIHWKFVDALIEKMQKQRNPRGWK